MYLNTKCISHMYLNAKYRIHCKNLNTSVNSLVITLCVIFFVQAYLCQKCVNTEKSELCVWCLNISMFTNIATCLCHVMFSVTFILLNHPALDIQATIAQHRSLVTALAICTTFFVTITQLNVTVPNFALLLQPQYITPLCFTFRDTVTDTVYITQLCFTFCNCQNAVCILMLCFFIIIIENLIVYLASDYKKNI